MKTIQSIKNIVATIAAFAIAITPMQPIIQVGLAQESNQIEPGTFTIMDETTDRRINADGTTTDKYYQRPRLLFENNGNLEVRPAGWNLFHQTASSTLQDSGNGYDYAIKFSDNQSINIAASDLEITDQTNLTPQYSEFTQTKVGDSDITEYKEIYPGIDAKFEDTDRFRKKSFILKSQPQNLSDQDELIFWETLTIPADSKLIDANGDAIVDGQELLNEPLFVELSNQERLVISDAVVFDENNAANAKHIPQVVRLNGNQVEVGIKLDAAYLNDPTTTYPVTIDPTYFYCQGGSTTYCSSVTDMFLQNIEPGSIFQNGFESRNNTDTFLYAGYDSAQGTARSALIKFNNNWNNIPANSTIDSAFLHVTIDDQPIPGAGNYVTSALRAFQVGNSWNSNSVVYSNLANNLAPLGGRTIQGGATDIHEDFNVTSAVDDWYNGTATNNGFLIKPLFSWIPWDTVTWPNVVYRMYSSRYGNSGNFLDWPYLEVTYSQPAQPNLVAVNSSINDTTLSPGETLTGYIDIRNNGLGTAAGGNLEVSLTNSDRTYVIGNFSYNSIAPNGTTRITLAQTVPYNINNSPLNNFDLAWRIDTGNTANETDENDNNDTHGTAVQITANADAIFDHVDVQIGTANPISTSSSQTINAAAGEVVTITYQGGNVGTTSVGRGDINIYSNTGSLPDFSAAPVQTNTYAFITPGGVTQQTYSYQFTVPSSGNQIIGLWIDSALETTESIEFNNQYYLVFNAQNSTGPDLVAPTITLNTTQTTFGPGQTITGTIQIRNVGNTTAPAGVIDVFFKQGTEIFDPQYRVTQASYSSVTVGSTFTNVNFSFQIPYNAVIANDYTLYWQVDATNTAIEVAGSGESNNNWVKQTAYSVQASADLLFQYVDMRVNGGAWVRSSSQGTMNVNAGDTIDLISVIRNAAGGPSDSGVVHFYTTPGTTPTYTGTPDQVLNFTGIPFITVTRSISHSYTIPSAPGTYTMSYEIDATNRTTEIDETNNRYYFTFVVQSSTPVDMGISNGNYLSSYEQLPGNTISYRADTSNNSGTTLIGASVLLELVSFEDGSRYPLINVSPATFNETANNTTPRTFTADIPNNVALQHRYHIQATIQPPSGFTDGNASNNVSNLSNYFRVGPSNYSSPPPAPNPNPNPTNNCTIRGLVDSECDDYADLEEVIAGRDPAPNSNQSSAVFDRNHFLHVSQQNDQMVGGFGADPVNMRTGGLEFTQVDFELPGRGVPIRFERTYNSNLPDLVNRIGHGWDFSYNVYAFKDPGTFDTLINFGGKRTELFNYDINTQTYTAPEGVTSTLTLDLANNTFVYTTLNKTEYRFNRVLSSSMAMLEEIVDRHGNTTTLGYTVTLGVPLLTSVSDASGRQINLTYGAAGTVEWDKIISLTETVNPVTSERRTVDYTYDTNGDLVTVTSNRAYQGTVETFTRTFTYDANHRMLTYTDKRGTVLTNNYDAQGRVTSQVETNPLRPVSQQDRTIYDIAYNGTNTQVPGSAKCTVVTTHRSATDSYTNEYCYDNNELLIYKSDGIGNAMRYTYYPITGLIQTVTDPNGNVTNFGYDSFRRKVSEVLPNITGNHAGIGNNVSLQTTNTYVYENTFNQLINKTTTVADSTGSITATDQKVWQYTINPTTGNLDSQTDPRGNSESYTYDGFGNRLTRTDKRGNTSTYGYDANGNYRTSMSIQVTDARGATDTINESYQYDVYGNRTQKTDDRGNATNWSYDTEGNLRLQTDALTNTHSYTYDAEGNVLTETNERGYITRYVWDANMEYENKQGANLLSVTQEGLPGDSNDDITVNYTYDYIGNRTSETHPELGTNFTINYTYDAANRHSQTQDPISAFLNVYDANGNITEKHGLISTYNTYNERNQLTETRQRPSQGTAFILERKIYDGFGRLVEEVDGRGSSSTYAYDANDNLLSFADGEGWTTTYTYDENNNQASVLLPRAQTFIRDRNANGVSSNFYYDELNRLIREVNAIDLESLTFYDGNGNMVEFVDRQTNATTNNTHVTTYQYDALNRQTRETDAYGNSIITNYDEVGNISDVTDKESNTTIHTYDPFNRLSSTRDAANLGDNYSYDKAGNLIQKILADGTNITYQYDGRGRKTQVRTANSAQETFQYDTRNNMIRRSDGVEDWSYTYDDMNRLTSEGTVIFDVGGAPTATQIQYNYDSNGNKTSVTGSFTNATYNSNNQRLTTTFSNGHTESYSYYIGGQVFQYNDGEGNALNYGYDGLGRMWDLAIAVDNARFTFDNWDNVLSINHPMHRITYTYDLLNRPLTEQHQFDTIDWQSGNNNNAGPGASIGRQYNNNGQLRQLTDAAGRVFDYTYDNRNLLDTVVMGTTTLADYDHSPIGKVSQITYGNGVVQTHGFDQVNRINDLAIQNGATQLRRQQYQYTPNHNRSQLIDQIGSNPARTIDYTYDNASQLQLVRDSGVPGDTAFGLADEVYQYDNVGNRAQKTGFNNHVTSYNYSSGHELTQLSSADGRLVIDYTYDGNGDLTQETYSRLGTTVRTVDYLYDLEKRLRQIQNTWYSETPYGTSYQQEGVHYLYDHNGNRTVKLQSADRQDGLEYTYYVNDGHRVINELITSSSSGSFSNSKSIVYGVDQIAQITATGAIEYVHTDPLSSTLAMTDASGNEIKQMEYAPFGEVMGSSGSADTSFQFTGQEYDKETELVYMNARYYNPELGRFIQKDPVIGYEGNTFSWNPYIYANNNPMKYTDPTGESAKDYLFGTAGYLFGYGEGVITNIIDRADTIFNPIDTFKETIGGYVYNAKELYRHGSDLFNDYETTKNEIVTGFGLMVDEFLDHTSSFEQGRTIGNFVGEQSVNQVVKSAKTGLKNGSRKLYEMGGSPLQNVDSKSLQYILTGEGGSRALDITDKVVSKTAEPIIFFIESLDREPIDFTSKYSEYQNGNPLYQTGTSGHTTTGYVKVNR